MGNLSERERLLLTACFVTVFVVVNIFVFRAIFQRLNGSKTELSSLQSELQELSLLAGDAELWTSRQEWVAENMPPPMVSVGRAQGELAEQLQQSLFERKIRIERQTLLEPVRTQFYDEVAVNLRIEGDAVKVNEWLTTLQSPEAFQTIKNLKLELDRRSRETEPQAECEVTVARWFLPRASAPPAASPGGEAKPKPAAPDLTES